MKPTCTCQRCHDSTRPSSAKPGPVGLRDLERRDVVAQRCAGRDVEVAALGRDRHDAVVVDPQHLEPVEVDERDHAVDRMGPLVVAGMRLDEGDARLSRRPSSSGSPKCPAGQASTWIASKSVMPRRAIAAWNSGSQPHELLGLHQLRDDGHRLDVGRAASSGRRSSGASDDGASIEHSASRSRITTSASRRGGAPPSAQARIGVLGRLAQRDRDEPGALAERREALVRTQDGRHRRHLGALSGSSG